ncbi:MAG: hypothetical protein KDA60_22835, partial [Planctomycetales bacterium]|nr:hypothetical protein [Planctomycetales bacterium]
SQLDEIEHQLSAVATDHAHDDDLLDNSSVSISNSITDACEASSIGGVHFNPLADGEAACEANDRTAANLDTIGPCRGAGTCDPFHETFDDEEELVLDVFASGRNSLAVRQSQLPADNRQLMETLLDAHTVADAFDDALRQQRSHDTPPEQDETPDPFEVADTKVAEDQVVTITWDPGTVQAVSDDSSEPQQRYDRNDWYSRQQVGPQVGLRSRRSPIFGHLFTKVRQARD